MSELKPCPHCKSPNVSINADILRDVDVPAFIICYNCLAEGPKMGTEKEAIAAWNTRDDSAIFAERKRCADVVRPYLRKPHWSIIAEKILEKIE